MKRLDYQTKEINISNDEQFYKGTHRIIINEKLELQIGGIIQWGYNYLEKLKFKDFEIEEKFFEAVSFVYKDEKNECYRGAFGHSLNFVILNKDNKNYLVLISSNERNVGLYVIFVEGVFEFEEGEIII